MSLFQILQQIGSVEIHAWNDPATGVRAFVAIHDTRLGPAVGGCRVHAYAGEDETI